MDELLQRIAAETGADAPTAKRAIGHILTYIAREGEDPAIPRMIAETPGAEDAMSATGDGRSGGLLGGMVGGGIMGLGSKLMGLGLGMGDIQTIGRELVHFAEQHSDPQTVDRALRSVPGFSQFL